MRVGAVKLLIQRSAAPQHAVDDVGGDAPDSEAGHVGRGRSWTRHWLAFHCGALVYPIWSGWLAVGRRLRQLKVMSIAEKPSKPAAAAHAENRASAKRPLPPAAERALAEAAVRRAERDRHPIDPPKEIAGREGPEPTRYGDWEINGLTSDF